MPVVEADYSSVENLAKILKGQDAVVSTVGPEATAGQKTIIDAAILAGVKRFIPSDFGSLTNDPKASTIPLLRGHIDIQKYLEEKAQANKIEYTLVSPGPFLEYIFGSFPLFADFPNKTVTLHGKGDVPFSATSLGGIGKTVAGILKNPGQTKNRVLFVNETVLTQARVLELAKKASSGAQWNVSTVDSAEALKTATAEFEKNPYDLNSVVSLLRAAILSGQFTSKYPKVDNEIVGLPLLTEEELIEKYVPLFNVGA